MANRTFYMYPVIKRVLLSGKKIASQTRRVYVKDVPAVVPPNALVSVI